MFKNFLESIQFKKIIYSIQLSSFICITQELIELLVLDREGFYPFLCRLKHLEVFQYSHNVCAHSAFERVLFQQRYELINPALLKDFLSVGN